MLNKNDYFYLDDTPTMPGKYTLRLNHEMLKCTGTSGSYNVLPARFLGISYANFLRLCRDVCGATLIGKDCLYVVPYFELNKETEQFVKMLNGLAKMAQLWQDEPNWQFKQRFMEELYKVQGERDSKIMHDIIMDKVNSYVFRQSI